MPLLDAPSISATSIILPESIPLHTEHSLHGFIVGPFSQFNAFAKIFAVLVLPVPLIPQKR